MSEGSERAFDNQSDGEAPIDEEGGANDDAESFGRESDLESVVPSEGSLVSLEEPVIRPAASVRGFVIGLAQLDAFTLTTIFERRAHVMRVVPHVMCAAFSSAIRVECEEKSTGSVLTTSFAKSGPGSFCCSSPGCSCAGPTEEAVFRGRNWSRGWRFSTKGIGKSWSRAAFAWLIRVPSSKRPPPQFGCSRSESGQGCQVGPVGGGVCWASGARECPSRPGDVGHIG